MRRKEIKRKVMKRAKRTKESEWEREERERERERIKNKVSNHLKTKREPFSFVNRSLDLSQKEVNYFCAETDPGLETGQRLEKGFFR